MTPAPADRDDSDVDDAPLAVLEVRYNPRVQLLKLVLILCIPLLVAFAVLKTDMTDVDVATWRFLGVIVLVTLIWATAQAMRLRDRRPRGADPLAPLDGTTDGFWKGWLEASGRADCLFMTLKRAGDA